MSTTLQKQVVAAGPRLRNGYTLFEGQSPVDKAPIAVIITGLTRPSQNPKTGPMAQTFVIRTDMLPSDTVVSGNDSSVCNNCSLRQHKVKKSGKKGRSMCYVATHYSVNGVFRGKERGIYPPIDTCRLKHVLRRHYIRFGAYGNHSNADIDFVRKAIRYAAGHTMYEHNWHVKRAQPFKRYAMASVASLAEKARAKALGWRTFRVLREGEALEADEVRCRHEVDGTQCIDCLLCNGNVGAGAPNVTVTDHGPTSQRHREAVASRRLSLNLVASPPRTE